MPLSPTNRDAGLLGSLLETHARDQIESRMVHGMIRQPQRQVRDAVRIAPAAGGHHPVRPFRIEHGMHAENKYTNRPTDMPVP